MLLILILIIVIYFYNNTNLVNKDFIQLVMSSIAAIGALIAFYQLKANHDWNKRHTALIEAEKNRDKYSEAIRELNKSINYREREDSYSLTDIHGQICVNKDHTKNPKLTDEGKEIKHNIYIILNYYEYLAVGIKNKVFDEITLKDLIRGGLIKANRLFGEYAQHIRDKHSKNKKQFLEMKELSERWEKESFLVKFVKKVISNRGDSV